MKYNHHEIKMYNIIKRKGIYSKMKFDRNSVLREKNVPSVITLFLRFYLKLFFEYRHV